MFRYHNSWVPELRSVLSVTPQTTTDALNFDTTFYPVAKSDLQAGRGYYGIPLMYDGLGLYYNKKIFQQRGITKPPTEWGDVVDAAAKLRAPQVGQLEIAGIAMGTTTNVDYWSDILTLLMYQNNASLTNPISTKENTETAINFFKAPATNSSLWDPTWPSSTESFAQGKLAMMFGVSWTAFEIQKRNPDLEFGIAPIPQLPGSKIGIANYWVEGVANNIDKAKQEEAWKFLAYLSSKEIQQRMHAIQDKTRLFGEPYARTDLASELQNNPYLGGILETAPQAKSFYLSDQTFDGGLDEELRANYADILNNKNDLTTNSKAIQTTLTKYGVAVSP